MSCETSIFVPLDDPHVILLADFPGYGVSRDGFAWSRRQSGSASHRLAGRWRRMKVVKDRTGHPYIGIAMNGRKVNKYVHALVLTAFVGPRPEGMDSCHNDGNPANNRVENLRWDTRSGNQMDRVAHGTANRGEMHPISKLTDDQVREIRRLYATGDYWQRELGEMFGVGETAIGKIVSRKRWQHI